MASLAQTAGVCALVLVVCPLGAEARAGGKGRTPILGWNTWCTQNSCGVDWCTSAEVLDVASAIKSSGLQALGYHHINLDDCWGVRNNATHQIEGDPERFPEGMAAFIQKVHDLGFKFGLYTDIGTAACHFPFTGSFPYYTQDAQTFASWKVDYVKFDGCHLPARATPRNLTCQMSDALNKTGRDMWLNFHCWHDEACATCGNSFRVGPDHHDNWDSTAGIIQLLKDKREPFWGPDPMYGWPDPDFVYPGGEGCGDHSDPGVRCPGQTEDEYLSEFSVWAIAGGQIVFATDPRNMSALQKRILFNTEVLSVFNDTSGFRTIRAIEAKTEALPSLGDPRVTCEVTRQISSASCKGGDTFGCWPLNNSMWTAKGCRAMFTCGAVQNVDCESNNHAFTTCACKPAPPQPGMAFLRSLADGSAAIVLHNPSADAAKLSVNLSDVPDRSWTSGTTVSVRDLWAHGSLAAATGTFSAQVNGHGVVMVTVKPQQP